MSETIERLLTKLAKTVGFCFSRVADRFLAYLRMRQTVAFFAFFPDKVEIKNPKDIRVLYTNSSPSKNKEKKNSSWKIKNNRRSHLFSCFIYK